MRSPDGRRATELREAHREKVARNEVRPSPLWAQPCRAHNVQIELDPRAKAELGEVQQGLHRSEPDLLVCPQEALHVSVAWLLAVHADYPVDKDALWERHREEWTAGLRRIAAESAGFRITYEHVVATDSAVIALARPTEPVNRIRGMIRDRLRLPDETHNEADLVHTTLFRYRGPLSDPAKFLAMLNGMGADVEAESASWSSRRSWFIRRWKRRCSRASRSPPARLLVGALVVFTGVRGRLVLRSA